MLVRATARACSPRNNAAMPSTTLGRFRMRRRMAGFEAAAWSIATSTSTAPVFIVLSMSRRTSLGAAAPGSAPRRSPGQPAPRNRPGSPCSRSASWLEPRNTCRFLQRTSGLWSRIVTSAPRPAAICAAVAANHNRRRSPRPWLVARQARHRAGRPRPHGPFPVPPHPRWIDMRPATWLIGFSAKVGRHAHPSRVS